MLEQGGEGREESHCSPVAFTVELRPQDTTNGGSVGFMVPTEQVVTRKVCRVHLAVATAYKND